MSEPDDEGRELRGDERADAGDAARDDTAPDSGSGGDIDALVRGALAATPSREPDLLEGFQRKVRERSGGKFYADGWSTSREPPLTTYLLTSLVMLAVVLAVYAVLGPLSGAAIEVQAPAPVNVVAPRFLAPGAPPRGPRAAVPGAAAPSDAPPESSARRPGSSPTPAAPP